MGIKHAVPLGNLHCKDFARLPVVAVCVMVNLLFPGCVARIFLVYSSYQTER